MKKLLMMAACSVLILTSCGGESEEEGEEANGEKIETGDVKGTINTDQFKNLMPLSAQEGEETLSCAIVQLKDGNEISICPSDEDLKGVIKQRMDSPLKSRQIKEEDIIEQKDDYILYKSKASDGSDGVRFILMMEGSDKGFYRLIGQGKNPFDPIESEEKAREVLAIAQKFKPAK